MWGFNRKKQNKIDTRQVIVEVQAHKDAKIEAAAKNKNLSKQFNKRLVENHFTLKLYAAAGGNLASGEGH